jgi:single-strand DNA-binding protein
MGLNHITIMGRLTRDPEMRRTGSGTAVVNFTVAVDRDFADKQSGQKETDFIDCVAWRHTGEFVSKYFRKGSQIALSGRLQSRKWTDKDGGKRTAWEVVADNCYFAGSKNGDTQASAPQGGYSADTAGGYPETQAMLERYGAYPGGIQSDFAMLEDDDAQLPF